MNLEFRIVTSDKWQTCFRCAQLGIATATIQPGEEHIATFFDGVMQSNKSCMDCYDRMVEELTKGEE